MLLHQEISEKIIGAFYTVYNVLGYGFLEKVYEKAMFLELQNVELKVQCHVPIKVFYDNQIAGDYFTDLLVEDW